MRWTTAAVDHACAEDASVSASSACRLLHHGCRQATGDMAACTACVQAARPSSTPISSHKLLGPQSRGQDHAQLTQDGDAPEENDEAHQDQGCPAQQRLASAPAYHPQINLGSTRHLHQLNAPCHGSKRRLVPDTCRATPQGIWCPESTGSACGAQPRGLPANEGVPEAKSVPQVPHHAHCLPLLIQYECALVGAVLGCHKSCITSCMNTSQGS